MSEFEMDHAQNRIDLYPKRKNIDSIPKLKQGDQVVMHTCSEHDSPENFGKIWTCRSDQFTRGVGVLAQDFVFLEGYRGSFAPEYLQKVDTSILLDQLAEKDASIKRLEGYKVLKGYAEILCRFIDQDGKPVDGFAFREATVQLRTTLDILERDQITDSHLS
ncbi:hypothetical protein ACIFOE_05040 [Paenibacillus sp. NRS-1783]|uniref:hypothetical protein n=1 Tax=Paenibacillus sp. NRS-1783 TaxID=3233907 RepID=UPI003D2DD71E